ncbi:MAG: mechanosensitive ion channel family protein [Fibrobacter sp.]|nr:mechanosensitive ion channel family protein [Fibrobacter sp.]
MEKWIDSYWVPNEKIAILLAAAILAFFLTKLILLPIFKNIAKRTRTLWDDLLVRFRTSDYAVHLVPATIIAAGIPHMHTANKYVIGFLTRADNIYFIIIFFLLISSFLSVLSAKIQMNPKKQNIPIHGIFQALKLVAFLVCVILILAEIINKTPFFLLSGLGALTAVLLLIFRDSILGLVSGIQISTLDLVRTGDWIEMPKDDVDGNVIEVSLTSVKIQNWDMSISVIPTYELTSTAFKNWRGMSESGGRRIKRSISVDVNTVDFLTDKQVQELLKIKILRPYLENKLIEIKNYNEKEFAEADFNAIANGRRLTNIGTFRAYCLAYLRKHPGIHQSMTLMVRLLQPESSGQPVEIYAFANTTISSEYENIQSDIFDHLIAVLPEFGLCMFQNPSGTKLKVIEKTVAKTEAAKSG